jgi:hypothetical protein
MTSETLKLLLGYNHYAIGVNARDLTMDESLVQPASGNCANWVLGHIVASRDGALKALGGQPVLNDAARARYARGSQPVRDAKDTRTVAELMAALDLTQDRLIAALDRIGEAGLGGTSEGSLGARLTGLQFHEAYHAGQLGLLRRMAGKPGAIA